ncbi:probable ATP-dependent RNA helicase DDX49 [Planococcus citri]|uniref:probable ATP-dependent RNA helicase DDX49 n=1 Tax=Planococcus citri TaxID=170843 RepID=UPI0031F94820
MSDSFHTLGLNPCLAEQCEKIGVRKPTVIQQKCIPEILKGSDCIGCSETGSGKTLAFLLPILHKFCEDPFGIFALILSPTRELCYQINDQISVVGSAIHIRSCVVTGGVEMVKQGQELQRKPHIVVATPGRLADHLESCDTFSFKNLKFLVLDEADKLFDGRFNQQIGVILKALPKEKQILLFSATFTSSFEQIQQISSRKIFIWKPTLQDNVVEYLKQLYVFCPKAAKNGYFVQVIRSFLSTNPDALIIVFTDTCKNCHILSAMLNELGFENVCLNALFTQKQRLASLQQFKSERRKILIATDVASRGLDIPTVSLVINHSIPSNATDYLHRVGRTARAKKTGTAISLITPDNIARIRSIEEQLGKKFDEYPVSAKDVAEILTQVNVTEREVTIKLEEDDQFKDEKKIINKKKKMIASESNNLDRKTKKRRKKTKDELE